MGLAMSRAIPELGQLVLLRDRHWVVGDIARSGLPADGSAGEAEPQHLLTLSSVEDDGLGEALEAGLVVQELLLRHRARTVLIVCPASLCEKWRAEMLEKFGLEFRLVNSATLSELRRTRGVQANPWRAYPRLIVSIDWL